jgi:hypothetical protein
MDSYSVGDKVKITQHYEANYPDWNVKGQEATIVQVKKFKVLDISLKNKDKPMYHAKYGIQKEYEVYGLQIELNGHRYIVSQFGFDK